MLTNQNIIVKLSDEHSFYCSMMKNEGDRMGVHLIAEFLGVESELIAKKRIVKKILDRAISKVRFNAFASLYHQFKPYGVSCVYLLRNSHLSLHSWPEKNYFALDVFSCDKDEKKVFRFLEILKKEFKPKRVVKKVIRRDYYEK